MVKHYLCKQEFILMLFHDQIFICKREDYIALVQDLLNMVSVVHFPLGVFASYTFM